MKKVILVLMIGFSLTIAYSFLPKPQIKINWITLDQLNELYNKNPRPILFDLYTDWCGWCKVMDRKTYGNQKVANYINEHYYAVKFNAESVDTIVFNNKKFGYNPQLRIHELANYLMFGRLEFPTTVFLSSVDARPAPLSGYMLPKEIEAPLKYFGEPSNSVKTFVEFNAGLHKEW